MISCRRNIPYFLVYFKQWIFNNVYLLSYSQLLWHDITKLHRFFESRNVHLKGCNKTILRIIVDILHTLFINIKIYSVFNNIWWRGRINNQYIRRWHVNWISNYMILCKTYTTRKTIETVMASMRNLVNTRLSFLKRSGVNVSE